MDNPVVLRIRKRNLEGAAFFGAFTLFVAGGLALCAYETAALTFGWKPVTQRTREAWHYYPRWMFPLVGGSCALLAHLFWGPPDTRADDVNP